MAFLGRILNLILPGLLDWLVKNVSALWSKWQARREKEKEIAEKNAKIREQTEKAETEKEREDAAKAVLDDF
jgi:sortase (surface protein transpeptidase)